MKAQSELLGLAMVILLLALGLIFVVVFLVTQQPSDTREEYNINQLTVNLNNAILDTSTTCRGIDVATLLSNCAQTNTINCQVGNRKNQSCEFVNNTVIVPILNATLDKWGYVYSYEAYIPGESPVIDLGRPCAREQTSSRFTLPLTADTLHVELTVCQ